MTDPGAKIGRRRFPESTAWGDVETGPAQSKGRVGGYPVGKFSKGLGNHLQEQSQAQAS